MYVLDNVPLSGFSTMRLGGIAAHLCEITERSQIAEAVSWATERQLPIIMIGEGSNIIWRDEGFPGLVLVNKILRYEVFDEDGTNVYVTAGGGENWDDIVGRTVKAGLSGLEELSLIPGTVGATPVQNVGAYGREVKDTITTVEAFDTHQGTLITIPGSDCEFDYRTSRFKTSDRGRFFITAVTYHLMRNTIKQPFYDSLQRYFNEHGTKEFTPQVIRDAVIDIRSTKLPDPKIIANNGSFFQNPVVSAGQLAQLSADFPDLVYWQKPDGSAKISAAWLLEKTGYKDFHDEQTGMATWPKQPLVFVNENANQTADLLAFKQKVLDAVQEKFNITLNQEPELLP
ncbi:MAG: UDP-N-acetylmuramate dehydrogenase [Candidatus Saccharibacteria bacterium]|nr:UDP-N-acetylmuramate dehydrogenase [Candidatus Saccharibacteria bacterium]